MADSSKRVDRFDAIVIGSGQGGTPLARALAERGARTALVEEREVGGTCVNVGCTPTKTMVASARVAHLVARAGEYGVNVEGARRTAGAPGDPSETGAPGALSVDLDRVRERKRAIVTSFRSGSERRIESTPKLSLVRGSASFLDGRTLAVRLRDGGSAALEAERIFINTGTRPALPEIRGLERVEHLDNESIMELDRVPAHLLIVGGGYIGVEFAQMFRRFGARVTVVHRGKHLLPREDDDVCEAVEELLRSEGIELLLAARPVSVVSSGSIRLTVNHEGGEGVIEGSHLLLAAGRTPNTDALDAAAAGVELDERGCVRVNERLETSARGIWALGDVNGGPAFTHVSYDDYRIVVRNLYGDGAGTTAGRLVPYTVFIDPQLGRVGMTEREARASGREVRVAKMPMSWVARALEVDESYGFMKAVVDAQSNRILGFAMLGLEGGEIAGAVQLAMMGGLPYPALRDAMFAHPTLMEALNNLFASL